MYNLKFGNYSATISDTGRQVSFKIADNLVASVRVSNIEQAKVFASEFINWHIIPNKSTLSYSMVGIFAIG